MWFMQNPNPNNMIHTYIHTYMFVPYTRRWRNAICLVWVWLWLWTTNQIQRTRRSVPWSLMWAVYCWVPTARSVPGSACSFATDNRWGGMVDLNDVKLYLVQIQAEWSLKQPCECKHRRLWCSKIPVNISQNVWVCSRIVLSRGHWDMQHVKQ